NLLELREPKPPCKSLMSRGKGKRRGWLMPLDRGKSQGAALTTWQKLAHATRHLGLAPCHSVFCQASPCH
ncbi:unnamed protein product, partial [Ilex paraguariensis]